MRLRRVGSGASAQARRHLAAVGTQAPASAAEAQARRRRRCAIGTIVAPADLREILFLAWRREATGAPSGLPASGSATVQLSRLLDHGIERRDWSPRRGSKFHRRTPHKRRAARLWRVVRSFVCCTCTCTHARVRAHAFAHAKARSADLSSNLPKVAARKSCVQLLPPHMGDTVPLLKPHPIYEGILGTLYAHRRAAATRRTSSHSTPPRTGMPPW